jgi:CRP/FNR family transcriptional regulator
MPVVIDESTKSLLRAVPYFSALDEETLAAVARAGLERRYQGGELIFLEGDPSAGLHLVAEGLCKVYHVSAGGREQVLAILEPGDSCNEVPVVDGGPNPASLAAVEDSTVWIISKDALTHLRQQYPLLNEIIIQSLATRCRQLVQRVYNLSFLSVTGRLAAFLLQHDAPGRRRWTQDEMAAQLGTVREMVSRTLRELQEAELVAVERHRIEILDREGLAKLT